MEPKNRWSLPLRRSLWRNSALPLLTLLLLAPTLAQDRRASDPFSAELIQKQIGYLASDELKGRGSGEPGNEKAAQYIAQEFARCGLRPPGTSRQRDANAPMDGSGYFQPFTFTAGREVGKGNRLETVAGGKSETCRLGIL